MKQEYTFRKSTKHTTSEVYPQKVNTNWIENTDEEVVTFDDGSCKSYYMEISDKDIEALKAGTLLGIHVNDGEYTIYVSYREEE